MNLIDTLLVLCLAGLPAPHGLNATNSTAPTVNEANGVVVVQVEAAPAIGGWQSRTAVAGYSGIAYYHNLSGSSSPGADILEYPFTISSAGPYQLQVRHRIDEGTNNTEANDSFLRLVDSAGSALTPLANNNVATGSGWYKFYMNTLNTWSWQFSNRDNDPKSLAYDLAAGLTYTVQLSRRSRGHAVDRIVLWNRSRATALGNATTGTVSGLQDTALNALPDSDASGGPETPMFRNGFE